MTKILDMDSFSSCLCRKSERRRSLSVEKDRVMWNLPIRKVGRLTGGVFDLKAGDTLFMRGPYGKCISGGSV